MGRPPLTRATDYSGVSTWDRAYFAGIFDAKGRTRIWVNGHERVPYVSLAISHHDIEVLEWLQSIFGGAVRQSIGVRGMRKDWHLSGFAAGGFLEMTRPYLRLRRRQADIVIEFCRLLISDCRRHQLTPTQFSARCRLMEKHDALLQSHRARRRLYEHTQRARAAAG